MLGNHALFPVPFNHVKSSFKPTHECKYELNHYYAGYKKVHYRHLPDVLTHPTLDKYFYLAQCANWHDENWQYFALCITEWRND